MPIKILMVCLGNICRSPLAEGILQSMVEPEKVIVDSAGTGSWHIGNRPDERSIAIALEHNIDISTQRCRQFTGKDFRDFDRIYVMDKNNYETVLSLSNSENDAEKVKLLMEVSNEGPIEVPDPYYGGSNGFENVYQMIYAACEVIAKELHKHDGNG